MRYILLLSTLAIGTCLGTDKVLATETTTTIELGDANPVAVGSAKGIMLIGDDAIIASNPIQPVAILVITTRLPTVCRHMPGLTTMCML